jgi:hypothetical protein
VFLTLSQVQLLKIALWLSAMLLTLALVAAWGSSGSYPSIPYIYLSGWIAIIAAVVCGLGGLACHLYTLDPPPER